VLVLAEPLVEKVLGEGTVPDSTFPAAELIGKSYAEPFPGMAENSGVFRVIPGDFVTTEDGTGLVHIAPAFG
jgi:isoleucyl-tRNA synthetase